MKKYTKKIINFIILVVSLGFGLLKNDIKYLMVGLIVMIIVEASFAIKRRRDAAN